MISYTLVKNDGSFDFKHGIDLEHLNSALNCIKSNGDILNESFLFAVNANKYVNVFGKYKSVCYGDKYNIFIIPFNEEIIVQGITGVKTRFYANSSGINKV